MVAFSKIALAAIVGAASASPVSSNAGPLAVFDQLKAVPKAWTSHGAANKEATIKAQIGLKQSNIKELQAKLLDISNPRSENYGKWMTKEEVNALTAPPKANVEAVKAWLIASGIKESDISAPSSDWLEFSAPVSQIEKLLDAK